MAVFPIIHKSRISVAKRKTMPACYAKTTENVVHFCCDSDLDKGEKFRGF